MNRHCREEDGPGPGARPGDQRTGPAVRFCVALLRGYKLFLSPLFPPSCRFTPTCSQYAIDAVRAHGVWFGLYLALKRILRCHPFARGGYDPVR